MEITPALLQKLMHDVDDAVTTLRQRRQALETALQACYSGPHCHPPEATPPPTGSHLANRK